MDSANAFDDDSREGVEALRNEIAAANAELKATQARLDALWAKTESLEGASRSGSSQQATQQQGHEQVQGPQAAQSQPRGQQQPKGDSQQPQQPGSSQQPQSYRQPSYAYQQQAYTYQPPSQPPSAQQPSSAIAYSKDHVAAGLLAIFLGPLGIHKFYLGYNTAGFIMLALTILGSLFTLGIAAVAMAVISIVEGITYLTKSQTEFEHIYVLDKKEWF